MAHEGAHGVAGPFFSDLLLIFLVALVAVAACRPLRLPGTLGYFVAGAILGPTGFALVDSRENIDRVAEFGVVLLLFTLGLEFSLPRLLAMRRAVFGMGTVQVVASTALFAGPLLWWGLDVGLAVVIGGGLALSSTALVSRELTLTGQLRGRHGQQAIGILLFQDLAAVFFLILVPALAGASGEGLGTTVALLSAKGVALFAGLMLAGRWLLPPLFHEIARSRSEELFVLAALAVVLGAAWLTQAMEMSMALGGFVGGMMLGESRYRHQVEADIRPFRDVLLGVFLVSVGMMLDLSLLVSFWPRVLGFGLILMVAKLAIITAVGLAFGEPRRTALRTGIVLAQGGEFAFALLALAASYELVSPDVQAFMVAVTLVSMVLTPALVRRSGWLTDRLLGPAPAPPAPAGTAPGEAPAAPGSVLLLGFGRVGQMVGRMLEEAQVPFLALDADPNRVNDAALAGLPIRFGDARRAEILRAVGAADARLVVLAIDDRDAALRALEAVRELRPTAPVLVRTRDDRDIDAFLDAGATEVVPETFDASLMLLGHVMTLLRRPRGEVERLIARVRADRYGLLHGVIAGESGQQYAEIVQPVLLPGGAWAVGRGPEELAESLDDVTVRGVRRRSRTLRLEDVGRLQEGDIVLLLGAPPAVERMEAKLLSG
ncbi:MAG: cation:proton antiporter [Pseudomonadales bacterium]|jgi:CPA2 family monovalent cation:H+ antiporter-2|nr:cation:proton antiporter [Pseudomonadales bacterium]